MLRRVLPLRRSLRPLACPRPAVAFRWLCDKPKSDSADASAEPPPDARVPELEAQVSELQAEAKKLTDSVRVALAEAENTRAIARKDVAAARDFAITKFAKSLLEVADNFDRAVTSAKQSQDEGGTPPTQQLANLLGGVEMIQANLDKAFQEHALVKYGQAGDRFDPHVHEAMFEMPDPERENGTVAQVLRPGYKLKERVVRPAQVGTVKN